MVVYLVMHAYEQESGCESIKTLGIFRSKAEAEAAIERARTRQGFRDYPDGFHCDAYEVGREFWTDGFIGKDGDWPMDAEV